MIDCEGAGLFASLLRQAPRLRKLDVNGRGPIADIDELVAQPLATPSHINSIVAYDSACIAVLPALRLGDELQSLELHEDACYAVMRPGRAFMVLSQLALKWLKLDFTFAPLNEHYGVVESGTHYAVSLFPALAGVTFKLPADNDTPELRARLVAGVHCRWRHIAALFK